jgi:hypothetical protein
MKTWVLKFSHSSEIITSYKIEDMSIQHKQRIIIASTKLQKADILGYINP